MQRREFIAISAAAAAASTVTGMPIGSLSTGPSRIAIPELVELRPDVLDHSHAIASRLFPIAMASRSITSPMIELSPLACTETRIANKAGIDIELRHPGCGVDSILYSAHNTGIGAFPAGITSPINPGTMGGVTLIINQRIGEHHQQHQISIDAKRAGSYLLAIPTKIGARTPIWRASTIKLNESRTPTQVRSLFESRARSCMLMSVLISEAQTQNTQIEGANHAN